MTQILVLHRKLCNPFNHVDYKKRKSMEGQLACAHVVSKIRGNPYYTWSKKEKQRKSKGTERKDKQI